MKYAWNVRLRWRGRRPLWSKHFCFGGPLYPLAGRSDWRSVRLIINVSVVWATLLVMKWSAGGAVAEMQAHPDDQMLPSSSTLSNVRSFLLRFASQTHTLKLSPQPHIPLMLGLLNMNSLLSFVSTKSISVPRRVSWAFFSMNTLTPVRQKHQSPLLYFYRRSTMFLLDFC